MDLETLDYLRFVFAFGLVLGLILVMAWLLRRYADGLRVSPTNGRARRLHVMETRQIDPRNRLVLVRRDDREHLILVGPGQGVVVEADIPATDTPEVSPADRPRPVGAPSNVLQTLFKAPGRR